LSAIPGPSRAQAPYPSRTVKLVVKAVAGGLPDTVARIVAQNLRAQLQQTFVVENKPGANGSAAVAVLNDMPADGYTLVVADGSLITTNVFLYHNLPYDPKDLVPVAIVARAPIFIATNQKVPVSTMKEFVDFVRTHPGKLNYGSSGIGSAHHLTMEAIKANLRLEISHVPYKGTGESIPALLGGHIEVGLAAYPSLRSHGATIKLLATNGPARSAIAPEVPPVADTIAGFDFAPVIGIFARAGTPQNVIGKVADQVAAAVRTPEAIKQFAAVGIEPVGGGAEEFARTLSEEKDRIAAAIKAANIQKQ
jgi:tripartite-type tricarboxylate transporter receptor subunit TctC